MKTLYIIILFLFSNFFVSAQEAGNHIDFNRLGSAMDPGIHHHKYNYKGVHSEVDFVFTSLFIFYKSFVSSQDGNSCTFIPSCSEYMIQAIRKKGMIVGAMAGFDRLTRCNGLSPEKYGYDQDKHVFIDPVN